MSSKFLAEFRQFFKPFSSWVCDSTFNFCILEKFYSMPLLIIYPPSDWKVIAWASVCECAFSCVSNICTNSPGGKTCFVEPKFWVEPNKREEVAKRWFPLRVARVLYLILVLAARIIRLLQCLLGWQALFRWNGSSSLAATTTVDIGRLGGGAEPHWGRYFWEQEPDGDPVDERVIGCLLGSPATAGQLNGSIKDCLTIIPVWIYKS